MTPLWKNYHLTGIAPTAPNRSGLYCQQQMENGTWHLAYADIVGKFCEYRTLKPDQLTGTKYRASRQLQPMHLENTTCTVILLDNLALLEWLPVACDLPLLDTVICQPEPGSKLHIKDNVGRKGKSWIICGEGAISHAHHCLTAAAKPERTQQLICQHNKYVNIKHLNHGYFSKLLQILERDQMITKSYFTVQHRKIESLCTATVARLYMPGYIDTLWSLAMKLTVSCFAQIMPMK